MTEPMSRRLLNLPTVLVSLALLCVLAVVFVGIRRIFAPAVQDAHTRFMFVQLDQSYESHLAQGNNPAASGQAFLALIPRWKIDWNSCSFRAGSIYDAWGTAVQVQAGQGGIRLQSAGPDRRFDTPDDIAADMGGR